MSVKSAASWTWSKIESTLSEPGTTSLSWGRCASVVSLIAVILWGSIVVYHTHAMPTLIEGTGFVTAPYVANKTATAIQAFSKNN